VTARRVWRRRAGHTSGVSAAAQANRGTRLLPPGGFAVVMATGAVSVAAHEDGLRWVSAALGVLAAVVYAVLAARVAAGAARDPRATAHHLAQPAVFGLLTLVVATDVLATRVQLANDRTVALVLAALALAAWLPLAPAAVRVARSIGRAARRRVAHGGWLNLVVATQSLAIVAGQASWTGQAIPDAGDALWALGLLLYAALIVDVLPRTLAAWREPRRHAPDSWIVMGALAISTLAGAVLHIAGAPTVTWAIATVAYAGLIVLEARVALAHASPDAAARWSTVFPLGMYAACSHAVGLHTLGTVAMAVALVAWLATAGALARRTVLGRTKVAATQLGASRQDVPKST
jgi:voltage-gated anion channel